jgi:GDP-L-fucose synthase
MRRVIVGHGLVGQALKRAMPDAEWWTHGPRTALDHCDELYVAAAKVGGVAENSAKPVDFLRDNVRNGLDWLNWAYRANAHRTLLFGSVCMYPRDAPLPHREEMLGTGDLEPTNRAYAMAKLCLLEAARAYHAQYGTQVSYLIPSNLYGPGDKSTHAIPEIIAKIRRAKETGEVPKLYGDGSAVREFLHVDDLVRACQAVMAAPYEGPDPINVGGGAWSAPDMMQVVLTICSLLDYRGEISWSHGPNGASARLLDMTRIRAFGWYPRISLPDGLRELCK